MNNKTRHNACFIFSIINDKLELLKTFNKTGVYHFKFNDKEIDMIKMMLFYFNNIKKENNLDLMDALKLTMTGFKIKDKKISPLFCNYISYSRFIFQEEFEAYYLVYSDFNTFKRLFDVKDKPNELKYEYELLKDKIKIIENTIYKRKERK